MTGIERQSHTIPRLERGRLAAEMLAGAWRDDPGRPAIPEDEYLAIAPTLAGNGSGGMTWWRIREHPLGKLRASGPMHDLYRHYTLSAARLEEQLAEVVRYLRAVKIEPILVKGWSIARLYAEKGLRPYGDVDIIVAPSQHGAASTALVDPARPQCAVELHRSFSELPDRSFEELFGRSTLIGLHETEIRVLAPEDHLRLLALHALNHALWRPLWLCDLAVMLEALPDAFDWDLCMAGDRWRSEGVRCALGLARELLKVSLDAVPRPWRDPPLPPWLVPAALRSWGTEGHYMAGRHMGEYLRQPRGIAKALRLRWPNPIEATYRVRAPFNAVPRLPFQIAESVLRSGRFLERIPELLRSGRERDDPETPPDGDEPQRSSPHR